MADPIPKSVKKLWNDWNIRAIILFSLSLQTFLILFAPYRKGSANKLMIMLIWSAYLLADWAANYAVGLISDSEDDHTDPSVTASENRDLLAFWPAFLLLHLGGPDTITAFALEDNELWLRHLLGLITQAVAAVYVFLQSLPENKLFIPTILMFAAGIIKYFERTRALYLASLDRFRDSMLQEPDPGPNYAKIMEEYASKKEAKLPARIITIPEPDKKSKATGDVLRIKELDDLDVVQYAYKYFNIFKGLIVDLIYSFRERDESRDFFDKLKSADALRIIEVELNFIYEVFYTKVEVIHTLWGYIFRFIAFGSVVVALSVFYFHVKKDRFDEIDVTITYTLFLGAIALDILSILMFVCSDWTLAALTNHKNNGSALKMIKSFAASILRFYLVLRRPRWQKCHSKHSLEVKHELLATPFLLRRWSGSVSGHNLIRYCLKGRPTEVHKVKSCFHVAAKKVFQYLHLPTKKDIIHNFRLAKEKMKRFWQLAGQTVIHYFGIDRLKIAIDDLILGLGIDKIFWNIANTTKKVIQFLCIGEVVRGLVFILSIIILGLGYIWSKVIQGLGNVIDILGLTDVVDEIRYLSHEPFSKELWQFMFEEIKRKAQYADDAEAANRISSAKGDWILQEFDPKGEISDELMSYVTDVAYDESVLLWHIATELLYHSDEQVAGDAREFSRLLSDYMLYLLIMQPTMMSAVAGIGKIRFRDTCAEAKRFFEGKNINPNPNDQQKEACKSILEVNIYVKPVTVKGDRSKSVLFDASMLAKELNEKLKVKEEKWELVSKVWVELLSYAASHCSARTHAQQVSKGGELITFVWLLMAHFGLGEQFKINKGQGRAKLIVRT